MLNDFCLQSYGKYQFSGLFSTLYAIFALERHLAYSGVLILLNNRQFKGHAVVLLRSLNVLSSCLIHFVTLFVVTLF